MKKQITIVGGGIIGSATAYFLSLEKNVSVKVLERDPTYTNASFARSCGGFRHQFVTKENILLGKFGSQFVKKFNTDVQWTPNGYLLLFNKEQEDQQRLAIEEQWRHDAPSILLTGDKLTEVFPWLNSDGIAVASYTDTKVEGWLDPHSLQKAFKQEAINNGVNFIKEDVKNLDNLSNIIVVTAGCWTKELLPDIPVVPQKHTVFNVKTPTHIPQMPLVGDFTSEIYWRPEGDGYIVASPVGRFDQTDLEPDWNDFEELIWEKLANRVPFFEEVKVTSAWAGYYDTNQTDNNAIIGKHPKLDNVYLASGFTGRGVMQAPGVGRGLTELITTGQYQTIDLSCFDPQRLVNYNRTFYEPYVL